MRSGRERIRHFFSIPKPPATPESQNTESPNNRNPSEKMGSDENNNASNDSAAPQELESQSKTNETINTSPSQKPKTKKKKRKFKNVSTSSRSSLDAQNVRKKDKKQGPESDSDPELSGYTPHRGTKDTMETSSPCSQMSECETLSSDSESIIESSQPNPNPIPNPSSHLSTSGSIQTITSNPNTQSQDITEISPETQTNTNISAKTDLNNISEIPPNIKEVIISCNKPGYTLTHINPTILADSLDKIVGKKGLIAKVEYLPSGSIHITTHTTETARKIFSTKTINIHNENLQITTTIAWKNQLTYGKLYAPEFKQWPLGEILPVLQTQKVVAIRKLFSDPQRAGVPLYVLTFLGPRPEKILLGYTNYHIDKYIPNPMRCGKCCRWGHSTQHCRGSLICGKCSEKGHKHTLCTSNIIRCPNCKGNHQVNSNDCPQYQLEVKACHMQADHNISFSEARKAVHNNTRNPQHNSTNSNNLSQTQVEPQRQHRTIEKQKFTTTQNLTYSQQAGSLSQLLTNPTPNQEIYHERQSQQNYYDDFPLPPISTQSQKSPRTNKTPRNNRSQNLTQVESSLHLHLTPNPTSSHPSEQPSSSYSFPPNKQTTQTIPPQQPNPHQSTSTQQPIHHQNQTTDLNSFLITLLPCVIKLMLSTTITDKIETLVELGHILKADSIVTSILSTLGHSTSIPLNTTQ